MNKIGRTVKQKILLAIPDAKVQSELNDIVKDLYSFVSTTNENEIIEYLTNKDEQIISAVIDINIAVPIVEKIRKIPSFENFPILICTKAENSEIEDILIDLNVIDFLKAPFVPRRVLNRLKTAARLSEIASAVNELERDELTGLFTRKAFLRNAEIEIANNPGKHFCIIAFDFDNFKSSNSLYGVEKCNEFLAYTAKKMMAMYPHGISGRYGGDQYIILFEYKEAVNLELLDSISKEILDTAPIPHQIVKMGIYAPIDVDIPIVICCDRAFLAINGIKGKYGKNLAFFENNLQNQLLNEQRIIESMERALEEEQFQVFYQPKHETITGHIAGAEALVRWNHPEYGFMTPNQFIPLFERNGFITKLDVFVIERVCKDIQRWQQDGYPLIPISINVSRRDFIEPGCIEHQIEIINSYGIDHSLLHMEVTESLYSENPEIIISKLKQVQDLGFMIEMDDFGAGYSSLGLLSSFPLNILKLDISFVRNIIQNEIVIENIIKMAHRMELLTVAEGAESTDQFKILKTLGCDYIQGFYFSKPLSISDFEKYLKKSSVLPLKQITMPGILAEETVPLSENMLMAASEVADGIPGGFFSYHADGELEIISFNKELIRMFGCTSADEFRDYVGNSFKGIVYSEDFDRVQTSIEQQITANNDIDFVEYRIKAKDGTLKYIEDYGRFVRTKNYGDIFYVFLKDITTEWRMRAEAESELVRKIELQHTLNFSESANRAKNIFMYNASKDIISTMRSIIDYTNQINNNVHDKELIQETLSKAIHSEESLLSFINNVHNLARIENNDLQLEEVPTDITNAVEKTYALIAKDAEEKNIKVEYSSDIYNPYIYQDIIHTTDVVVNILTNAIKYTPSGGKIKFSLKQTPCKDKSQCMVSFTCEDTGIGISPEFLPYACNSFAREDNQINHDISSSGLGLSLAKTLLELMHGSITITSELGKGTKVVTLQPHRFAKKEDLLNETSLVGNVRL